MGKKYVTIKQIKISDVRIYIVFFLSFIKIFAINIKTFLYIKNFKIF